MQHLARPAALVTPLLRPLLLCSFMLSFFVAAAAIPAQERVSLNYCIATALKHHPTLHAASAGIVASQGRRDQARSPYFPQIHASTGYSENHATSPFGDSVTKGYTTTLSVNQLLYDFGKTGNALDASRADLLTSEEEWTRAVHEVILNVKKAYFALLESEQLVVVAHKTLEQAESHLKQALAFFRSGAKPRFDVTRAEVEVNNAKLGLLNANNSVRLNAITLNNAMGTDPSAPIAVEDLFSRNVDLPSLAQAQEDALKSRPEMKKAEVTVAAARARIKAEQSNYFPILSAAGSYSWASGTSEAGAFFPKTDIGDSWNAGITLTLPLFEGGLTRGRVSEARATLLSLEAQRNGLKQSILFEVNQAYADLENAAARIEVMESSLKKARENLEIARGRYQAGVGPYIEVTDAQVSAVKAETDFVSAQYDYQLAIAKLETATGKADSKFSMQSAN